jgi:hypothetical protein
MPHIYTLPIAAGLTIAASATGIWLGNSAIREINPAHYSVPETRFHADLTPYRSPDQGQVPIAQDASFAEGLGSGCINCRTYPEEYYPNPDSYYRAPFQAEADGDEDGWSVSADTESAPAAEPAAANPEWERVQAYAAYRVSQDERPAPAAEVRQGAQDVQDAPHDDLQPANVDGL